jgi:hypothetical protein
MSDEVENHIAENDSQDNQQSDNNEQSDRIEVVATIKTCSYDPLTRL